jgi:hypothetical protein
MSFEPQDKPIDPTIWKPSPGLSRLAMKRCDWVNCHQIDELSTGEEWLAAIIVSCYYQGLADGIKHMARKQRAEAEVVESAGEGE